LGAIFLEITGLKSPGRSIQCGQSKDAFSIQLKVLQMSGSGNEPGIASKPAQDCMNNLYCWLTGLAQDYPHFALSCSSIERFMRYPNISDFRMISVLGIGRGRFAMAGRGQSNSQTGLLF
jgi:hypothetical protein